MLQNIFPSIFMDKEMPHSEHLLNQQIKIIIIIMQFSVNVLLIRNQNLPCVCHEK